MISLTVLSPLRLQAWGMTALILIWNRDSSLSFVISLLRARVLIFRFLLSLLSPIGLICLPLVSIHLGVISLVLGEHEIEHYGTQEDYGNGVLGKYGVHYLRENQEHVGGGGESKSNAERKAGDNHVAL